MIKLFITNTQFITVKRSYIYTLSARFTQTETTTTTTNTTTSLDNTTSNPSPTITPEINNDPSDTTKPLTFAELLEAQRENNRKGKQAWDDYQAQWGRKETPANVPQPTSTNSKEPVQSLPDTKIEPTVNSESKVNTTPNTDNSSTPFSAESTSSSPGVPSLEEITLITDENLPALQKLKNLEENYAKIKTASDIASIGTAKLVEKAGVEVTEHENSTKRQEALVQNLLEFGKTLAWTKNAKRAAYGLAIAYSAYYILRYRQLPFGLGSLLSGAATTATSTASSLSNTSPITNSPVFNFTLPTAVPPEVTKAVSSNLLEMFSPYVGTFAAGVAIAFKFFRK